jgi:hypothetical protein
MTMKLIPILAAILIGLSTAVSAQPGKIKISHGGGKKIKSILLSNRDSQTGERKEKRILVSDGTFDSVERKKGDTGIASSEECQVQAVFELQDGSTVELQNLDICGLDELVIE